MKLKYLVILVACFAKLGYAQVKPVIIADTTSPSTLPFDRSFKMTYTPSGKKKITAIQLLELDKCGCIKPFECCKCGLNFKELFCLKCGKKKNDLTDETDQKDVVSSVPIQQFDQLDSGEVNFLMPQLGPNRKFMLVIMSRSKPDGIDKVIDDLANGRVIDAREKYATIIERTRFVASTGNACGDCDVNIEISDFDDFKAFFSQNVKSTFDSLLVAKVKLQSVINAPPVMKAVTGNFDKEYQKEIIDFSQQCLICTDTLWQQMWLSTNREETSRDIVNIEKLRNKEVYSGNVDLKGSNIYKGTIEGNATKRLINLGLTIESIGNAGEFIHYAILKKYNSANPSKYNSFIAEVDSALKTMRSNYSLMTIHKKVIDDQTEEIKRLKNLMDDKLKGWEGFTWALDSQTTSTFTYNFNTRAGYAIKADFGFLAYGGLSNNNSVNGFAPYLGFHVNFRPMNTDVPFKQINCKGLQGHLSFHSGLIIGSFKKDDERDGIIGGNAIFTGLGWAFGHGVRLTAGAVWFKQKNPSPLVNDMNTAAVPYVGLALDLRLNDIYKSFKTIFVP
jgi:hypothetical protein